MATSIIKFHSFSGASDHKPPCFILQIDQFHCLFDCGWENGMDLSHLEELSKWIKYLDAVFISHATPRHCGLLPHLVGNLGLSCPIYSTIPTSKLGQLALYDMYQSIYSSHDIQFFNLDDVDAAFSKFITLKYQQAQTLTGRGHGISVMPYPSGYILGGTIWKIFKEDTEIVYAIDFNHKKERHLNGAAFDACMKPYLLIMDASNSLYMQPKRKDRDDYLRQICLKTLRQGGNVLIVTDSAGRCLEISHFLEAIWHATDAGLMAYGLAMLSNVAFNVFDYAKNLIEWMSDKVIKSFEEQRSNPFIFKHMQLCHTWDQFNMVLSPKVVLASMDDLKYGFAKQLFVEYSTNPENAVIITKQVGSETFSGDQDSIISKLYQHYGKNETKTYEEAANMGNNLKLSLTINQRIMLPAEKYDKSAPLPFLDANPDENEAGDNEAQAVDLEKSDKVELIRERTRKRKHSKGSLNTSDYSSSSSSDSEEDEITKEAAIKLAATTELDLDTRDPIEKINTENIPLVKGRHQHGYDILRTVQANDGGRWFKTTKKTVLAFQMPERVVQYDDYGEPLSQDFRLALNRCNNTMSTYIDQQNQYRMNRYNRTLPSGDTTGQSAPANKDALSNTPLKPGTKDALNTSTQNVGQNATNKLSNSMKMILNSDDKVLLDMFTQNSVLSGVNITDWLQQQANKVPEKSQSGSISTAKALQNMLVSKCISHDVEIEIKCPVFFIDYECKSDGEAIKKIVNGIRPQEIILVGYDKKSVEHLADYCRTSSITISDKNKAKGPEKNIHIPRGVDVINCTKEDFIYQAKMSDSLVSQLRLTKIKDYELAWVDACLLMSGDAEIVDTTEVDIHERGPSKTIHQQVNKLPTLIPLPSNEQMDHGTVLVNEPKMSDLKQIFLANGLTAEFVSGILVVGGCVSIKRMETGKLNLEGKLTNTYFTVRRLLYQQFAIL